MSYFDEEFYYEPSEFDLKVEELKESLTESVKEEFVKELEELRKENAELRYIKNHKEEFEREIENKKRELEMEKQDMKRKVKRERLDKLMEDFQIIRYKAGRKFEKLPKCDKCDERRYVHYKTPLGRDEKETCTCAKSKSYYVPEEHIACEFRINRDRNSFTAFYELKPMSNNSNDDYYAGIDRFSTFAEVIYNEDKKFEDLNTHKTFFDNKEECQKYCDWLNAKESK